MADPTPEVPRDGRQGILCMPASRRKQYRWTLKEYRGRRHDPHTYVEDPLDFIETIGRHLLDVDHYHGSGEYATVDMPHPRQPGCVMRGIVYRCEDPPAKGNTDPYIRMWSKLMIDAQGRITVITPGDARMEPKREVFASWTAFLAMHPFLRDHAIEATRGERVKPTPPTPKAPPPGVPRDALQARDQERWDDLTEQLNMYS